MKPVNETDIAEINEGVVLEYGFEKDVDPDYLIVPVQDKDGDRDAIFYIKPDGDIVESELEY